MSEKKTDIEDLPPAEMGQLDDLDFGADFPEGDLPDLEDSDELLDPFVGDTTGLDPLNGSDDTGLDDLPSPYSGQALTHAELDDVLDDLEPHHLEDENSTMPDVMADQMPMGGAGDDLESITLSEEELDNILGTGQDVLVDVDASEMPDPEEMRSAAPVGDFAPDQSDFDADLESGGSFDELGLDEEFPDVSGETLTPLDGDLELLDEHQADSSPDFGEEPVLMDDLPDEIGDDLVAGPAPRVAAAATHAAPEPEEGPVALSEEELDNILGDVDLAEPMELATLPPGEGYEDDGDFVAAPPSSMEDEEEITLSDDELSNVLLDTDDEAAFASGVADADTDLLDDFPGDDLLNEPADLDLEMGGAAPSILDGDDDEDEPVTLSLEELGNIVSDVATEEAEESVPLPDEEQVALSILDGDEDEGPVALSEDELSNILEDVDEEQAEDFAAPVADADERNIIVLDEYEDQGEMGKAAAAAQPVAPAAEPDRSELVASTAARTNVDPGEVKKVISYLDRLFDQLPEETIREFSKSEYFDLYKKLMGDLGLLK